MIFNLTSVVDWRVMTSGKQQQVDIDKVLENAWQVTHDCEIDNLVYLEMTGIYHKLYYKKEGLYRIKEVFTNSTVQVQLGQVNKK